MEPDCWHGAGPCRQRSINFQYPPNNSPIAAKRKLTGSFSRWLLPVFLEVYE